MAHLVIDGIKTLANEQSLRNLARLAADVPAGQSVVELGVFRGGSLRVMSEVHKPTYGIDLFGVDLPDYYAKRSDYTTEAYDIAREHAPLATLIQGDTALVGVEWDREPVGLLHVDGDHTYEGVCRDWAAWEQHLAPGAVVVFDDYLYRGDLHPGVTRFVQERWGVVGRKAKRQAIIRP